jgi:vesicle coat complex subunit
MRNKKVDKITSKYKKKEIIKNKIEERKIRQKKNEIQEIKDELNSKSITIKQKAIRQIIGAMTLGKDVSVLFPYIVKNMETQDLKLKKLIYLYIINYARVHTELAIMATNTFQKDAMDKNNPMLRALAVRTMGCLGVRQVIEYLIDPLRQSLSDEDSYVRKTGVLCVAKIYDSFPELIEENNFISKSN